VSNPTSQTQILKSSSNYARKHEAEKQFLRFYLESETKVILPLEQITEVQKIGIGQIVPIPQMPPWVIGIYNWRGNILWMLDLGHLIGLNSWYQQGISTSDYTIIVLSVDRGKKSNQNNAIASIGLIITRVEDIIWCNTDLIQSPPASAVTTAIAPFLKGYWLEPNGDMVLALDANAIIKAMPQNFHD
jgi:positive phototaxis protein PixI